MVGSGSNMDDIVSQAHVFHKIQYKKKSNFDRHWNELRRFLKWRTPSSSGSTKRTKLSGSGAYSSSTNNETLTYDNVDVEFMIRPKCTKVAKRKG